MTQQTSDAIRMTGDPEGRLYAFIDDFECSPSGVTGQINFKDDIEAGNFPYRAHLRF